MMTTLLLRVMTLLFGWAAVWVLMWNASVFLHNAQRMLSHGELTSWRRWLSLILSALPVWLMLDVLHGLLTEAL